MEYGNGRYPHVCEKDGFRSPTVSAEIGRKFGIGSANRHVWVAPNYYFHPLNGALRNYIDVAIATIDVAPFRGSRVSLSQAI
jgi:hypothetical protein